VALFAVVVSLTACTSTSAGPEGSRSAGTQSQSQAGDTAAALQLAAETATNSVFRGCELSNPETNLDGIRLNVSESLCSDLDAPLAGSVIGFAVLPQDAPQTAVDALHRVVQENFSVLVLGPHWAIVLDRYAGVLYPSSPEATAQVDFFQTLATELGGTLIKP
jgi:hypothetical protein